MKMKKLERAITRRIWIKGNVFGNQYSSCYNGGEYGTIWECKLCYSERYLQNIITSQKVINFNIGLQECSKQVKENTKHYDNATLNGLDW